MQILGQSFESIASRSNASTCFGITVTAIALVGSTAIAGVIAGGLGNLAYLTGFTRNQNDVILVSTVFILIIVFIIQFIGDWLTNKIDKR